MGMKDNKVSVSYGAIEYQLAYSFSQLNEFFI